MARPRPRRRSRAPIILGALLALLVFREIGYIDFTWTFTTVAISTHIVSSHPPKSPSAPIDPSGHWIQLPGSLPDGSIVLYSESRTNPGTRWIPLYKSGQTIINRSFIVVQNDQRLLEGVVTWYTHFKAYGLLSARSYAKLATPPDKDFLSALANELPPRLVQSP